jgi:hypothetical protein
MALLDKLRIAEEPAAQIDEEILNEYEQDPVPNEPPATRGNTPKVKAAPPSKAPRGRPKSTTTLAKEVGDDLATMIELGATVWGMRDQCCAPVLAAQSVPIAHSITTILARNPRLLEKFANTDIAVYTVQLLALGKALTPVGSAIFHNHISKAGHGAQAAGGVDLDQFPAYPGHGNNGYEGPQFTDFGRD